MEERLFSPGFCIQVRRFVELHHTIYPLIPPQGVFFESIVQQAFRQTGWPETQVIATTPNSPQHDLLVGRQRLSIKTETGKGSKRDAISITKLCTTEREPWNPSTLVRRTLEHLSRYDRMLMLRAIWGDNSIAYQLLEIPLTLLRQIDTISFGKVGTREGRRSLGGDVLDNAQNVAFHVHFDGADGKCQIRNLRVEDCVILLEWNQPI